MFNDLLDETKGFKFQIICQKSCQKNTKALKSNILQFISIQQQKQLQIINLILINHFEIISLCTELITGLMKVNQLIFNTLIFHFLDHYQHVLK